MLALNAGNKLDAILIIPFISFLSQNAYHLRGCTEMRFIFESLSAMRADRTRCYEKSAKIRNLFVQRDHNVVTK